MDSRPPVSHIPRAVGLTEAACGAGLPPGWEELRPVGNKVTALFITPPPPPPVRGPCVPSPSTTSLSTLVGSSRLGFPARTRQLLY